MWYDSLGGFRLLPLLRIFCWESKGLLLVLVFLFGNFPDYSQKFPGGIFRVRIEV